MLADGSEYRGRYGVPASVLRDFHRPRLELLIGAGPDLLAVETIPDTDEAEVLVELLAELDFPAWFSYSIDGSRTRAGQPLKDAFAIAAIDQVVAVGINCCRPDDVQHAVETAVTITGKPAIAYPNSGESWDATTHQWTATPTITTPTAIPGPIADSNHLPHHHAHPHHPLPRLAAGGSGVHRRLLPGRPSGHPRPGPRYRSKLVPRQARLGR